MMPDGRVLYMRWEYVDRSRVQFHHLWTANPDGTGAMVYFGNMHSGTVMLDAKPIGGTTKVVSVFSPGHGRKEHAGRLAIVDPDAGPDERKWVRYLGRNANLRDPYPLEDGDLIRLGKPGAPALTFRARTAEAITAAKPPEAGGGAQPEPAFKEVAALLDTFLSLNSGLVLEDVLALVLTRSLEFADAERGLILLTEDLAAAPTDRPHSNA